MPGEVRDSDMPADMQRLVGSPSVEGPTTWVGHEHTIAGARTFRPSRPKLLGQLGENRDRIGPARLRGAGPQFNPAESVEMNVSPFAAAVAHSSSGQSG
jgi:hypothetical protein